MPTYIPHNQIYGTLTSNLPSTNNRRTIFMSVDLDTMIMNCMNSVQMGFELVYQVQKYKNTPSDRIKLIEIYESEVGQLSIH